MSDTNSIHKRNIEGLRQHAIKKREETYQRVSQALARMKLEKLIVNFNSVSAATGVSKTYLYNYFRAEIETLRSAQDGLTSPRQIKNKMTDSSKDVIIAAKNKRIAELENEILRLKHQLDGLYQKLYES